MEYLHKVIQCLKKCHFIYCYRKISNNILSEQSQFDEMKKTYTSYRYMCLCIYFALLRCSFVPDSEIPWTCSPPGSSVDQTITHYWILLAGCHFLFQEMFLIQGSNPSLSHLLPWQVSSLPVTSTQEALVCLYVHVNFMYTHNEDIRNH